jgi:hypothetical protein
VKDLGKMFVPLSDECSISILSPNKQFAAVTMSDDKGSYLEIIDQKSGKSHYVRRYTQPVTFRWHQSQSQFFLNNGEGSGQVSRLLYFWFENGRWKGSRKLDLAAEQSFKRKFDCRGGKLSYANVSGMGWTQSGLFRTIVTEGVHSEGCLQPYEDRNVMFQVIGNSKNGTISSAKEVNRI